MPSEVCLARTSKIHHHIRVAGLARLNLLTLVNVMLPTLLPHAQKNLVEWSEKAYASNLERGLLSLPVELTTEILDYFPTMGPYTEVYSYYDDPILPEFYLVRVDILRALSQVCIDYRRLFLPLLWESLNPCLRKRKDSSSNAFYEDVGDALQSSEVILVL
jgi:hypothetical protein